VLYFGGGACRLAVAWVFMPACAADYLEFPTDAIRHTCAFQLGVFVGLALFTLAVLWPFFRNSGARGILAPTRQDRPAEAVLQTFVPQPGISWLQFFACCLVSANRWRALPFPGGMGIRGAAGGDVAPGLDPVRLVRAMQLYTSFRCGSALA